MKGKIQIGDGKKRRRVHKKMARKGQWEKGRRKEGKKKKGRWVEQKKRQDRRCEEGGKGK